MPNDWPTVPSTVTVTADDSDATCIHRVTGCAVCTRLVEWEAPEPSEGTVKVRPSVDMGEVERIIADHSKGPAVTFAPLWDGPNNIPTVSEDIPNRHLANRPQSLRTIDKTTNESLADRVAKHGHVVTMEADGTVVHSDGYRWPEPTPEPEPAPQTLADSNAALAAKLGITL